VPERNAPELMPDNSPRFLPAPCSCGSVWGRLWAPAPEARTILVCASGHFYDPVSFPEAWTREVAGV